MSGRRVSSGVTYVPMWCVPKQWELQSVSWWAGSRPEAEDERGGTREESHQIILHGLSCDTGSRSPSSTEYAVLCVDNNLT